MILMMTTGSLLSMPVQAQDISHGGSPSGVPNGSIPLPSGVTADMIVGDTVVVAVRPHTVGLGQTVLINFWMEPPVALSRYIAGYQLTLTKPDGSKELFTLNSFQGDSTGYLEYNTDQLGTWKVDLTMPGAYFPAGNYTVPLGISGIAGAGGVPYTETFTRSLYYKPSSAVQQTFTVQSEAVASWPPASLPTNKYWTRPVEFENREWATILGDYPWSGPGGGANWPADTNPYWSATYQFTPYVQGPTSAHIVWKRQGPLGGASGLIGEGYNAKSVSYRRRRTKHNLPRKMLPNLPRSTSKQPRHPMHLVAMLRPTDRTSILEQTTSNLRWHKQPSRVSTLIH